jgi:hypothetical protein
MAVTLGCKGTKKYTWLQHLAAAMTIACHAKIVLHDARAANYSHACALEMVSRPVGLAGMQRTCQQQMRSRCFFDWKASATADCGRLSAPPFDCLHQQRGHEALQGHDPSRLTSAFHRVCYSTRGACTALRVRLVTVIACPQCSNVLSKPPCAERPVRICTVPRQD